MNPAVEQIVNVYNAMPMSRKILVGTVLLVVLSGLIVTFFWAGKTEYRTLFANMSNEDAAKVMDKLKEARVPYQISGDGAMILVPADQVHELRLTMAGEGLPSGGGVGFEIFNQTDFGATEFVQKLNYKRALQGELARTIREFDEVTDARVLIVMPKDSVFIEEARPPSASVLLKLRDKLPPDKVRAVVHLVASAVEDLTPDLVTVVDTEGRVLSKRKSEEDKLGEIANEQLKYKMAYEQSLARRVQSMLETIVGPGKAIVRVSADMDFHQIDTQEETYDPDAQVARSRQNILESRNRTEETASAVSSVNPVPERGGQGALSEEQRKQNETINYEISRTVRKTIKPMATVSRLSVAAVLDGTYETQTAPDGTQTREFVPRTEEEIAQFRQIVQNAMGYNADREDQITVDSFPFSETALAALEAPQTDWVSLLRDYGHLLGYIVLILLAFMFIVRPVARTVVEIKTPPELPPPEEELEAIPDAEREILPEPSEMSPREKAAFLAREDVGKAANILRGWLSEDDR